VSKLLKWWLLAGVMLLLLAGCRQSTDLSQPPDIRYGEDVCERCNMIISEARYAAAYVTTTGVTHRFDDIGGMLVYWHESDDEVAIFWVHDFPTATWLTSDKATFVYAPEQITPMGLGIVAYADSSLAQTMAAQQGGTVYQFAELQAQSVIGGENANQYHDE